MSLSLDAVLITRHKYHLTNNLFDYFKKRLDVNFVKKNLKYGPKFMVNFYVYMMVLWLLWLSWLLCLCVHNVCICPRVSDPH